MTRFSAGALLAVALLAAPPAAADPDDWLPYCTSGQVPVAGECKPLAPVTEVPGADPQVPMGLDPESPSLY